MESRRPVFRRLLNAVSATGFSDPIDVTDKKHIHVVISTSGNANGTVKFAGSFNPIQNADPNTGEVNIDFSSAAGVDNEWDYIYGYNYQSNSGVAGDTGVVYNGTDAVEQYLVNVDGLKSFAVDLSAHAAGNFTVKAFLVNNQ